MTTLREKVEAKVATASGIAWDGCHKIYILMDEDQMAEMRDIGYGDGSDGSELIALDALPAQVESAEAQVMEWYAESCSLRFIQAVSTDEEDPIRGYEHVVAQFEDGDDDE